MIKTGCATNVAPGLDNSSPPAGVVPDEPAEHLATVASSSQQAVSWRTSRLSVALNASASALSALEPTAPMDCVTPSSSAHNRAQSLEV